MTDNATQRLTVFPSDRSRLSLAVWLGVVCAVVVVTTFTGPVGRALAQDAQQQTGVEATVHSAPTTIAAPSWMEPQGLNVVDLVGLVPEDHLRGAIIAFAPVNGILQYMEGQRYQDRVVMRVKVWPRFEPSHHTYFNCPSLRAFSDHWLVAMPAGTVRLFQGDVDITDRIMRFDYFPSGLIQPTRPATGERYRDIRGAPIQLDETGAMKLPANQGCTLVVDGIFDHGDLTAVFTLMTAQEISVTTLGSQSEVFRVYRGGGFAGRLTALQDQLKKFGSHHDKFWLNTPIGADYVLLNYPPTPVSASVVGDISRNIVTPASGTYRLASGPTALSVDHQISMGLPLYAQYRDADQSDGRYLTLLQPIDMLASLEYFVPTGVAYHPCMQFGGCSDELLRRIIDTQMQMVLHYYRIEPIGPNLVKIPLQQVGRQYSTSSIGTLGEAEDQFPSLASLAESVFEPELAGTALAHQALGRTLLLPMIGRMGPVEQDEKLVEVQQSCPCGWFTPDGRMVAVAR